MFLRTRQSQLAAATLQGFTLVEVLIALIIMSVGMLGIAGLYVHSMNAGRTSIFRHQAVTLAGDIADRIRANPGALVNYQAGALAADCSTNDCDSVAMAQNDIAVWEQQARDTLNPNATVNILYTDVADPLPDTYRITITWPEAGQVPAPQYSITIPVNDFTAP